MAKIQKLYKREGKDEKTLIYPATITQAIKDGETGQNLHEYMNDIKPKFKFDATQTDSQLGTVGTIQLSQDGGKTWNPISPEFLNNLRIQGYVATTSALPTGKPVGTIYGVGPTYAAADTAQTNPIYRLYVYNGSSWVDNGLFTSIAAGIVQETGNSETQVMSQKATTEKLTELASKTNKFNSSRIEELYLVGNLNPSKKYYFQYLRAIVRETYFTYQIRIAEYSMGDKSDAKEVCRIETSNNENQGVVLHLQEQNDSGISGYIVHNITQSDVINETPEINISFSYIGSKISKYIENITNLTCINNNLIERINSDSVDLKTTNIFNGVLQYQTIQAQSVPIYAYSAIYLVFDIMQNKYLDNYVSKDLTSTALDNDTSKIYIQICSFTYGQLTNTIWDSKFGDYQGNMSKLQLATNVLSTSQYFGNYINAKMRIKGFSINLRATDNPLNVYMLDMGSETLILIQSFSTSELSVGVNTFTFSSPIEIGGTKQLILNGNWGYKYYNQDESPLQYNIPIIQYDNTSKRIIDISPSVFYFPINFILDIDNSSSMQKADIPMSDAIIGAGNSNLKMVRGTKLSLPLSEYTRVNAYSYIIGNYIPYNCKVSSIEVNVRDISTDIEVYKINIKERTYELVQSVKPTEVGELTITLDNPVGIDINNQIGLVGKIGYISSSFLSTTPLISTFYWNIINRDFVAIPNITEKSNVEWGIKYNYEYPLNINYQEHFNINIVAKVLETKQDIEKSIVSLGQYKTITVNIADYENNLRKVFETITPSESVHYIVEIPEGTYDVSSWFTSEEIANRSVGLRLANYTKLVGLGNRDKVILQWDNSKGTYNNDVSTLNTSSAWHELENLTIISNNVRYAVHDDSHYSGVRHIYCKNCRFLGIDSSRAWGAGTNYEYHGVFEDCRFDLQIVSGERNSMAYVESMCLHDYESHEDNHSSIDFINCRFTNPYDVTASGQSRDNAGIGFTHGTCKAKFVGCKTDKYINIGNTCRATGYGNRFGGEPMVENPISGIEYLDFV